MVRSWQARAGFTVYSYAQITCMHTEAAVVRKATDLVNTERRLVDRCVVQVVLLACWNDDFTELISCYPLNDIIRCSMLLFFDDRECSSILKFIILLMHSILLHRFYNCVFCC